jgi:O-antigen ligase
MPNFGFSQQTSFGVLEVSDALIVPFIVLLLIAPSANYRQRVSRLNPLLWAFLVWAVLSTLSIHFRYGYLDDVPVLAGCCLKLGHLVLYVIAGISIAGKLSDPAVRREWMWSLVAALLMLSIGLLASTGSPEGRASDSLEGYKSYNAIIVSMAILCCYVTGLWVDNACGRKWSRCAALAIVFAVCSVLLSTAHATGHGRGGWVGLAVGCGYLFSRRTRNVKIWAIIVIVAMASFAAYETIPKFESLVDMTLSPTEDAHLRSVDDGGRVFIWGHEAPRLFNAPVLGTGFYHRGGLSGLWECGSHNFFIQMFLETGVVGGVLVVGVFVLMWYQAGSPAARKSRVNNATRAALIAAIVGGMSETYFYGNGAALLLFALFAVVGSLPTGAAQFSFRILRLEPSLGASS